jgi:2,3,4,5-tetrahydropyridine-2-carboxylate N-succinyltransferase
VKEGILAAFRSGVPPNTRRACLPSSTRTRSAAALQGRGRRAHRAGRLVHLPRAHIAKSVVMMPPAFVNVGAFVDEGTMIDSHALVGSCAQVGKRVHLSAAAQIGGVLEPIGNVPVIIEDDVVVGGNCGIYDGVVVRGRGVIGAGVVITASTPIYDVVRGQVYRREIPYGASSPGTRPMKGAFAEQHGLQIAAPLIVKYRDEKTDSATALEEALR